MRELNQTDFVSGSGAVEIAVGVAFAWASLGYQIGKDLAEGDNLQCKPEITDL